MAPYKNNLPQVKPTRETLDLEQVERFAATGLNLDQISALLNVPRRTFQRWAHDDEEIQDALEKGKANSVMKVAQTAYQLAVSGKCPAMTMFYLKTQGRWKEVHQIEQTNVNISAKVTSTKTGPETLEDLQKQLEDVRAQRNKEIKDVKSEQA